VCAGENRVISIVNGFDTDHRPLGLFQDQISIVSVPFPEGPLVDQFARMALPSITISAWAGSGSPVYGPSTLQ